MDRLRGAGRVAAFVLFVLTLAAVLLWVLNQLAAGDSEREQQATEIAALQSGLDEANSRLAEQGEPPVDVPPVESETEPQAPPVVVGPTSLQISAAVREYCAGGQCDGEGPSKAQVTAAVTAFCENDACRGEPGKDAPPPADGKDGDIGAQGPGPTAEQITAAVEAYCSAGACRGADGSNGKDSTVPGPRGTGFADVECHSTGDWIFTLTDGTAITVEGPCRVVTQPSPTPTTTP